MLIGEDGVRDEIRGGVCLEQPMVRLWWGVEGLGRMGSGMGGRVGGMGRGVKGGRDWESAHGDVML